MLDVCINWDGFVVYDMDSEELVMCFGMLCDVDVFVVEVLIVDLYVKL